jgi:toxin CptA
LSARRLRLELRPSRLFATAIVAAHAAAGACALLALPLAPASAIAVALVSLGWLAARRQALLASPASLRVLELEGPRAAVTLASGARLEAPAAARRYVGSLAVALSLGAPVRRTILVTRDMLDADSFRRLRVWALWGRLPVAAKQLPA